MTFNITTTTILIVLTQAVLTLYGAGLRRPFGSVETVVFLPLWLRQADNLVLVVDLIFAAFVLMMWGIILYSADSIWFAALLGLMLMAIGDRMVHRISLVSSFWLSIILAVLAAVLAATVVGR
jgi:hypothetical protein